MNSGDISNTRAIRQINFGKQVVLHLFPGGVVTIAYIFLARYFHNIGLPSILGFFVASLLVLFPIQLGLPIFLERRKQVDIKASEVFTYREKIPYWQMVLIVIGVLLWAAVVFLIGGSVLVEPLRKELFSWVPNWFEFGQFIDNIKTFSRSTRIKTWWIGILFGAIVGPTIEEFYFRSYLLPRMEWLKAWAPLVGGVLMCLYHFWSPWLFIVRLIAIIPMVYAVWWKRNVYIGVLSHCLLNLIGDHLLIIPFVFG